MKSQALTALAEYSPQWWGPNNTETRIYLNQFGKTKYAKQVKIWIEFTDPENLLGATLKARVDTPGQPANYNESQAAMWLEKYGDVISLLENVRQENGISADLEHATHATAAAEEATLKQTFEEVEALDAAEIEENEKAWIMEAKSLSEARLPNGNIETRYGLPEHFTLIQIPEEITWANKAFPQKTFLKRWLTAATKSGKAVIAQKGTKDIEKRTGSRGSIKYQATEPNIIGVVTLKDNASDILIDGGHIITAAKEAIANEPNVTTPIKEHFTTLYPLKKVAAFSMHTPGFNLLKKGDSRTSGKGITWNCVANGNNWYVAVEA